jgi:hypothetical protein
MIGSNSGWFGITMDRFLQSIPGLRSCNHDNPSTT